MWNPFGYVRRRRRATGRRPLILMYHRVARPRVDPWDLSVHPERFEQQLAILQRTRHVLPMSEFIDRLLLRELPSDAVALTFDDGYADNLHAALPRLAAARIPALLFLTTGAIGQRREYWWDELARLVLLHRGEVDCDIVVAGESHRIRLPDAAQVTYLHLWRRLRGMSAGERGRAMEELRERFDPPEADPNDFPMTHDEVEKLVSSGVFDIGCHTVTHAVLPSIGAAERDYEIRESRRVCEHLAKRRIEGFAYPHGEHDADSRAAVRECAFRWACGTSGPPLSDRAVDQYAVSRVAVRNWDPAAFERMLDGISA